MHIEFLKLVCVEYNFIWLTNIINFFNHFCKDIELNLCLMTVDFFDKAKTARLLGYLAPSQS